MDKGKKVKYRLLSGLLRALSFLPLQVHRFLGSLAGFVMLHLVKYRRDVALKNLRNAFPDKSSEEIDSILKKFYRYLGTVYCEATWFGSCRGNMRRLSRARVCDLKGQEYLNGYTDSGKSVIVLMSHTGNFELISGFMTYVGDGTPISARESHIAVSYKRLHNEFWNDFMYRNRLSGLLRPEEYDAQVESADILRFVYRHKDDAYVYHFITDQYPYGEGHNVEVDFLNARTLSMTGGLAMARKLCLPVLYLRFACRLKGGYTIEYLPFCDDASREDIGELTQKYYTMLEEDIRRQPWNYLWTHKRWKSLNY